MTFPHKTGGRFFVGAALQSAERVRPNFQRGCWMYKGTLITDLLAEVERAENFARRSLSEAANARARGNAAEPNGERGGKKTSETEQFPQTLGLSPAYWNLGLLLVVHAQLVRAFEPGDNLTDAVDVHQVGAMRPPKKIRV